MQDCQCIAGSGKSPGEGNDNPLQYSCLENPMGKEAWQSTVHGVTNSQTQLKWLSMYHRISKLLLLLCLLKEAIAKLIPITLQQRLCLERRRQRLTVSLWEKSLPLYSIQPLWDLHAHTFVCHIRLQWSVWTAHYTLMKDIHFYPIAASHAFGYALWNVLKCALIFRASQLISPSAEQSLSLVDVCKLLRTRAASYHIFNVCSSLLSIGLHLNLIFFLKNNFTICIYLSIWR